MTSAEATAVKAMTVAQLLPYTLVSTAVIQNHLAQRDDAIQRIQNLDDKKAELLAAHAAALAAKDKEKTDALVAKDIEKTESLAAKEAEMTAALAAAAAELAAKEAEFAAAIASKEAENQAALAAARSEADAKEAALNTLLTAAQAKIAEQVAYVEAASTLPEMIELARVREKERLQTEWAAKLAAAEAAKTEAEAELARLEA